MSNIKATKYTINSNEVSLLFCMKIFKYKCLEFNVRKYDNGKMINYWCVINQSK